MPDVNPDDKKTAKSWFGIDLLIVAPVPVVDEADQPELAARAEGASAGAGSGAMSKTLEDVQSAMQKMSQTERAEFLKALEGLRT